MQGRGCGVSANEYSCAHEAQINFGDLTPYLTYGISALKNRSGVTMEDLGLKEQTKQLWLIKRRRCIKSNYYKDKIPFTVQLLYTVLYRTC
jgi:hypothetical protein